MDGAKTNLNFPIVGKFERANFQSLEKSAPDESDCRPVPGVLHGV
jgi:hypothetical protein